MNIRRKKEWFDDDSFWQELYPFMFPDHRFAETPEEIKKVLTLTNPGDKSALDLCCGPGRCSIALAKAGFKVTGVDRTKYLLQKARSMAHAAKRKIEWVQMDMRDFVRADAYDLAISMFTSFGYFDEKNEDLHVLRNIFSSLRSGGVFLIEMMGKEILAKIFQPTTSDFLLDGTKIVQRHEIFDDWTRIRNEWILIRKGRAKSFKFHHTIYSGQELRDRMEIAGFTDIKLYGNLDGDEYGPDALRLIAVGHKLVDQKMEEHQTKTSRRRSKGRA
jgi:SAM-dependent methyltransferase